jgi:crossover junction endodeoxyribonuclease RuvC
VAASALPVPGGVAVLGIDPGFASCGVALVRLMPIDEKVVALAVIRTVKDNAKRRTYAADDNLRRARELHRVIDDLIVANGVRAIAAEAMSFPRNASNSAKMALCWGVLVSIAEARGLPIVQASPQALKRAVTGSTTASKDEVEFALLKRFGNDLEDLFTGPDGQREHAFDALAAVVACLDSDVLRALRPRASEVA